MALPNQTFPQSGDPNYAENFAQLVGQSSLSDYVEYGLNLTPDYTVPEVTVSEGVSFIYKSNGTTAGGDELSGQNYVVQTKGQTVALTDGAVNHVFVNPNISNDDSPSIFVETNESDATQPSLKIGEVDTSADTESVTNRIHPLESTAGDGLRKSSGALSVEPADFAGAGLADDGSDNLELVNDTITATAGDGLKGGGATALGSTFTFDIEPADFAGAGLSDDGSDNLALTDDSITATAGDGLTGGGATALGGTFTFDINPYDFAGAGLNEDGTDNLELTEDSVTVASGTGLTGGGTVALGGTITLDVDTTTVATETWVDDNYLVDTDPTVQGSTFGLPTVTSDPSSPNVGDMWYRSDLG